MSVGQGIASISLSELGPAPDHRSFTDALQCSATHVDGYRLAPREPVVLPAAREQLCIPIESGTLTLAPGTIIPAAGIACVPAGTEGTLESSQVMTVAIVSAVVEGEVDSDTVILDLDACEFSLPGTSDIVTARLTRTLSCAGMKVNARILSPGQHVPYHTEGDQEELFVPVRGPATMRIADERLETPVGTITWVAPSVPRSVMNEGGDDALWVMVGAPPTGGPEEWDPGSEILE